MAGNDDRRTEGAVLKVDSEAIDDKLLRMGQTLVDIGLLKPYQLRIYKACVRDGSVVIIPARHRCP